MAVTDFMTLAEFNCSFPEFQSVNRELPEMIPAFLLHAQQQLDPSVFGKKLNYAHGLITAHLMAISPSGQQARMVSKQGTTTYGEQYRTLVGETSVGILVSGGPGPLVLS